MNKRQERESRAKYGSKNNDVIDYTLRIYGAGFCVGNCLKMAERIKRVSEMSYFKRKWYQIFLRKGNRADIYKIKIYGGRMKNMYPLEYHHTMKLINRKLGNDWNR